MDRGAADPRHDDDAATELSIIRRIERTKEQVSLILDEARPAPVSVVGVSGRLLLACAVPQPAETVTVNWASQGNISSLRYRHQKK